MEGGMKTSEILKFRIALTGGPLAEAMEELWMSDKIAALFPEYLILMQQIIRASVPLMEAARQQALQLPTDEPLRRMLADYLAEHIEEEQSHDEWTLDDLEAAGFLRADVLRRMPKPKVASLVGAQYYWLHHHHPANLLGYIYVLEGSPGTKKVYDELEARSGLPAALFRTYRMHGELDPDHKEELEQFIDSLPLTPDQVSMLGISAMNTTLGLAECVQNVVHEHRLVP
jgi:hypothetical protein